MRVLMISKACVVGTYQRKLEEIAKRGVDLMVIVPPVWSDPAGAIPLERVYTAGYQLVVEPIRFNGDFHWYCHPHLGTRMAAFQPDIVHIDEEPYNLATWHALYLARKTQARTLFFSWQNLNRRYPPPFAWGERWTLNHIDFAIMGTQSAAEIWQAKGYRGPYRVIPQFGIDPAIYYPAYVEPGLEPTAAQNAAATAEQPFVIAYIGRLVEEKGIDTLLEAVARLHGSWCLKIVGQGPQRSALVEQARALHIAAHIEWLGQLASTDLPEVYRQISALVISSRTRPRWKEQFGRVIIEANASGVPVIGSDSGAIPALIGAGGLVFPEGDAAALATHLQTLLDNPSIGHSLGAAGRDQVLAKYTQAQVATATVAVYEAMMGR